MSFVDELRKPNINNTQQQLDNEFLEVCIGAIRKNCLSSKDKRYIKGYIYWYNDDGYGWEGDMSSCLPKKITNSDFHNDARGILYPTGKRSLYGRLNNYIFQISPGFKDKLINEISKLGFTNYKVLITPLEDETQIIDYGIFGRTVKYEKNGKKGYSIFVEIKW